MKEQLIAYKTAKLAKEKGFDIHTYNTYIVDPRPRIVLTIRDGRTNSTYVGDGSTCSALTQSLLQKWLREEHYIFVYVLPEDRGSFRFQLFGDDIPTRKWVLDDVHDYEDTYEEALENGLKEALSLIKI